MPPPAIVAIIAAVIAVVLIAMVIVTVMMTRGDDDSDTLTDTDRVIANSDGGIGSVPSLTPAEAVSVAESTASGVTMEGAADIDDGEKPSSADTSGKSADLPIIAPPFMPVKYRPPAYQRVAESNAKKIETVKLALAALPENALVERFETRVHLEHLASGLNPRIIAGRWKKRQPAVRAFIRTCEDGCDWSTRADAYLALLARRE